MKLAMEPGPMNESGNARGCGGSCVPPVLPGRMRTSGQGKRVAWVVGWSVAVVLGLALVHGYAPDAHGFYPLCGTFGWSGLHCPGCGSLRAIHHLTHGRLLAALGANAVLVLGLGSVMVWGMARWRRGRAFGWESALVRPWVVVLVVGLLLMFTLLRNLPWAPFSWLAP
jgi:hypothetical protein